MIRRLALVTSVVLTSVALIAPPASAGFAQPALVSADPADWTPRLPMGSYAVHTFAQVGDTMYAGGRFTTLSGAARQNLAAFSATSGALTGFAPRVNGEVWALVPTDDGHLLVGGSFTSINGIARRGIARIRRDTGAVDPSFDAHLGGKVYDAELVSGRLIVSGTFPGKLAALDPMTGADTGYLHFAITGSVLLEGGGTRVYRFAVDPGRSHLLAIGKLTSVDGQSRARAFMVDLGYRAILSPWYYQPLANPCRAGNLADYLRDVDFSPDGSWFVMVSTGYVPREGERWLTVCDAAARFETDVLAPERPTWINYTGGDTLHSVAITGVAVYLGGHNRWLDNPEGRDFAGPGAVDRPGIGALDPVTGVALSWNPRRTRGVGAKVLYPTPAGLWVGSDTAFGGRLGCSHPGGVNHDDCTGQTLELHPGIGFLPLR